MLKDTKINSVEFKFTTDSSNITMTWYGVSNDSNPSTEFYPFFESIIPDLKEKNLIIDFRKLKYMNSSTIHPIVHFLKILNDHQVQTVIYYNQTAKWQSITFKALEVISRVLEKITIEGKYE